MVQLHASRRARLRASIPRVCQCYQEYLYLFTVMCMCVGLMEDPVPLLPLVWARRASWMPHLSTTAPRVAPFCL